jgi:hypothetical protein
MEQFLPGTKKRTENHDPSQRGQANWFYGETKWNGRKHWGYVTIPSPNFYLKNISPDKVMTFLRQWRDYCLKYNTYVNPLTVVHQSILKRLARKHKLKDDQISSLNASDMHDMLEEECVIIYISYYVHKRV